MDEATMAEIEARANAATPGPWRSGGFYGLARASDGDTAGWRHGAALPLGRCTFCRDAAGPCPATLMHRGEYDAAPRAYHAHWIAAEPGEGWQGISSDAAALAITGNYDYDRGGVCSTPEDSAFIVHARADVPALVAEVRRLTAALDAVTTEHAAALDAARREGAEGMREVVKAEIHAAFHYNDPPDDGRERPIAPRAGEWEAHQTLRKLLSRVCVVLTEGGAS